MLCVSWASILYCAILCPCIISYLVLQNICSPCGNRVILQLQNIQEKVDSFVTPSDIGRLPGKIASNYCFTAEQWRNWTLIYSLAAPKYILPHRHYDCWLLFVKSTRLLCQCSITLLELDNADALLMEFCEKLYGEENCTINMHLHGHLKECVFDFGPVYSFWLFSFERISLVPIGDIPLQVMRRFLASEFYNIHNWPTQFKYHLYLSSTGMKKDLCYLSHLVDHKLVKPLPPIYEAAWETYQKRSWYHILYRSWRFNSVPEILSFVNWWVYSGIIIKSVHDNSPCDGHSSKALFVNWWVYSGIIIKQPVWWPLIRSTLTSWVLPQ